MNCSLVIDDALHHIINLLVYFDIFKPTNVLHQLNYY